MVRFWWVTTINCDDARKLFQDPQQPAEVGVVERSLNFVEHIEGAGSRLEDRHQQRNGGERPLAPRQQRKPLDLLAGGTCLHFDPGGQHVRRVGEHQASRASGEQSGEDPLEFSSGVVERGREDLLHAFVHFPDDFEQVAPGPLQVLELLGQEGMALLQSRELLQRQRIDPAEQVKSPIGRPEALLLLAAVIGPRLGFGQIRVESLTGKWR